MPGLNGRELAARMKAIHPESKVLLVSGFSETLALDNALQPDIHYLPKPFSPDQLTRVVSEILSIGV
jgi:two-component system cell cycle sensor histidine kinase/response regulator CckA